MHTKNKSSGCSNCRLVSLHSGHNAANHVNTQQRTDHLEPSVRNRIQFHIERKADGDIVYQTKRPELWLEEVLKLLLNIKIKPLSNDVYSNCFDVQSIDAPHPTPLFHSIYLRSRLAFKPHYKRKRITCDFDEKIFMHRRNLSQNGGEKPCRYIHLTTHGSEKYGRNFMPL